MGVFQQAHTYVRQATCVSTAGIALQPYIKPIGCLNSNPKQLVDIWYILILSYDLKDLKNFGKRFCKVYPCTWFWELGLLLYYKAVSLLESFIRLNLPLVQCTWE